MRSLACAISDSDAVKGFQHSSTVQRKASCYFEWALYPGFGQSMFSCFNNNLPRGDLLYQALISIYGDFGDGLPR